MLELLHEKIHMNLQSDFIYLPASYTHIFSHKFYICESLDSQNTVEKSLKTSY